MPERSYDVAVLEPQCLLDLTPRFRELGISPEEANQRDIGESRFLMLEAYERALETVSRRHGVPARLEFHQFVPDELADSGRGGAVSGIFEFIRVVVDSDIPGDVLANLISDAIVGGAVVLSAIARQREFTPMSPDRQYTAYGIQAMSIQHAQRVNEGRQVDQSRILKSPSKTSISKGVYVVAVGLGEKELTYVIANDGVPQAIVETTQREIRLLSTDEWREWYLVDDS